MRELIKKILKEEVLNLNEFKIDKKSLLHDLRVMDFKNDDAEEELNYHIEWFKSLPKELTLYRIVYVDDESEINKKEPGSHYSIDKESLIENDSYTYGYGDKKFLLTVKVSKSLVDPQQTISNNILYPNEKEITLKNKGRGAKVIDITELEIF